MLEELHFNILNVLVKSISAHSRAGCTVDCVIKKGSELVSRASSQRFMSDRRGRSHAGVYVAAR